MSSDLDQIATLRGFAALTGPDEERDVLTELLPLLNRILAATRLMRGVDIDDVEMALSFRLPDTEHDRE
jgi:superfamily II DNA/RNA helicase